MSNALNLPLGVMSGDAQARARINGLEELSYESRLQWISVWLQREEERSLDSLRKEYKFLTRKLTHEEAKLLWAEALRGYYALNHRRF